MYFLSLDPGMLTGNLKMITGIGNSAFELGKNVEIGVLVEKVRNQDTNQ